MPTAGVILIGNEILSGRTRDANLAYIAAQFAQMGIRLREARVVEDIEDDIVRAVNEYRAAFDYVITTGGIGPTHDDITTASVARAFGVPVVLHPDALAVLESWYGAGELNEARLKMAQVPQGAALIDNAVSAAPGFRIGNVFVLAGIPRIMQAMFEVLRLGLAGGAPIRSRTVRGEIRESLIAAPLAAIQARFPDVAIGSYPFGQGRQFGTAIVLRGTDTARLDRAAAEVHAMFTALGVTPPTEMGSE